jgi:hypothetical protein
MPCDPKLSALFTKNEIDWLMSKKKFSSGYERKIKSDIRKKLNIFYNYELPLLLNKGFDVTKYYNTVTANCNNCSDVGIDSVNIVNPHPNSSIKPYNYNEIQSLGRDLIPRPFPYQGNALPG